MTTNFDRESKRAESDAAQEAEAQVAADPAAEDDNSPKSETSSTLLYMGIGIPLILFLSTGIFGVMNGYPFFAFLGFGVSALLLILAVVLIVKLVRANRGRSHH